jgi:hypothetical protein
MPINVYVDTLTHPNPPEGHETFRETLEYNQYTQMTHLFKDHTMIKTYQIFWGDTHHNTYQDYTQNPGMDEILAFASTYLDFYSGAYYTPIISFVNRLQNRATPGLSELGHLIEAQGTSGWRGAHVETLKDPVKIRAQWQEFQEATAAWKEPGRFIAFPGYEWQGDGSCGDHNVMYRQEGQPIYTPQTIGELYACLRGKDAIAIPHHIGYQTGLRAPDWSKTDETISPYAEIFSIHGCSETDEEWIGLRRNSHMGPGASGGVYQRALDLGLHLGAVCSTDNWTNMPGCYGQGLMGVLAEELSRESLWKAFNARRVYGVTGDRIRLDFTLNGAVMGSRLPYAKQRTIRVHAEGADAIDRIELLRNGRVIATHCHQGSWELPRAGQLSRYKLRIEAGWGPRPGELPFGQHAWQGKLNLSSGRFTGWQPCWVSSGQGVPQLDGGQAEFSLTSLQTQVPALFQGGVLLEFESTPESELYLQLNGEEVRASVASFVEGSRIVWYREECVQMLKEQVGLDAQALDREDPLYHFSFKAKLHRAIPAAGYQAQLEFSDDELLKSEANYRVRVEQRNGQKAWSSPIWVAGQA